MKKTNLKEKLQNWKLGNYFRELSIVTAGVFITLAGTDFINSASQEKQINKSMQMIKMELEENLKSINQAEAAYLNEINFFRLLIQKQDSLQTIKASILENNANAPFAYENCEYSEDALEVLKSSALMQQIPDKEFILKLLQAYKGCRKINDEGGNLAASKIRNLECPSYEICLIDYGCGKFNRKIHIMEQYP